MFLKTYSVLRALARQVLTVGAGSFDRVPVGSPCHRAAKLRSGSQQDRCPQVDTMNPVDTL
jgi:hypothetical protein